MAQDSGSGRADGAPTLEQALAALGQVVYVFHRSPAGTHPLDLVGPGLEEMLGRTLPDDLGAVAGIWAEAIHGDDRSGEARFMAEAAQGRPSVWVYRIVRPDGDVRWVLDRAVPLATGEGDERVAATVSELGPDAARTIAARVPRDEVPRSATTYVAERGAGRLVVHRIASDWAETTGIGGDPGEALAALERAVLPADADAFRERLRLILAGQPYVGTYRVTDDRGRVRRLLERASPHESDGAPLVDGVVLELVDEPGAGAPVIGHADHLRTLLELVDAHVYTLVVDEGRTAATAEFLGPGLDIIYGATPAPDLDLDELWDELVHPDDRDALAARWRRLMAGEAASVVYRIEGLDGVERWIRDRARPRTDALGRLVIDGIATPADHETTETPTDRASAVLGSLDMTVFELELTADGARALYASPAIARILGGEPPPGRDLRDVWLERLHPGDRELYAGLGDDLRAGRAIRAELRFVGFDGRTRRVAVRAHPVRQTRTSRRAVGIAYVIDEPVGDGREPDLTDRQREVLERLGEGLSSGAIASDLVISVATVRNHVMAILRELGAHSRLEAVAEARRLHLI